MNYEYIKGWRDLEYWYAKSHQYIEGIDRLNNGFYDCTQDTLKKEITNFINSIDIKGNTIVKLLKSDSSIKKWVWFSEGFVQINPLEATNSNRQYPAQEKISFPDKFPSISLSNDEKFRILQTDKRVVNKIVLPISQNSNHYAQIVHYDASHNYELSNKGNFPTRLRPRDTLIICVNNLKADKTISISQTNEDLNNKGNIIQQLNAFGDSLDLFTNLIPASLVSGSWGVVSSLINPGRRIVANPLMNISASDGNESSDKDMDIAKNNITSVLPGLLYNGLWSFEGSPLKTQRVPDTTNLDVLSENIEESEYIYTVNKRWKITSTKNSNVDKKAILHYSQIQIETGKCNLCTTYVNSPLIDTFLIRDACYEFNYNDRASLDKSSQLLQKRFNCFIAAYDSCQKHLRELLSKLNAKLDTLNLLVRIKNRSLPPVHLKEMKNDVPLYRTSIIYPEMPEKDKKVNYLLIESSPKAGKEDSLKTFVARNSFKMAKYFYYDFSLGIAFTTEDYKLKSQSSDSLPIISEADRFRFLAGVHIYPFGLDKLNNRFAGRFPHPLSIFAGMSIPKGFDNIYGGLSYDWSPGIRTIVGVHVYKDTKFTISNNQIIDKATGYTASGMFVALNLEPLTLIKYLGLF